MPIDPWISVDETKWPDDPEAHEAVIAASFLLYAMSGRKYAGIRTVTEIYEVPIDGLLSRLPLTASVITMPGRRYQTRRRTLRLNLKPVISVNLVRVGVERRVISSVEYELYNSSILRPTAGASWTPVGEIEVTYTGGAAPPEIGKRAARVLANELLKARLDRDNCQLPERVTSVSRQNLSMTILDPQDFLDHGRTGIYEIDLFLKAVNPSGAKAKAKVFSPDLPRVLRAQSPTLSTELGRNSLAIAPGVGLEKTFTWTVGGKFVSLTGNWTPSAGIYDKENGTLLFDLTTYVTLDPDNVPGTIHLAVPAANTVNIDSGAWWSLSLVKIGSPSTVVRITSGPVVIE